ncbi:hypothetical protein AK830_g8625 [Neonectria ditissima]|uniref:GCVT N-terminal domain-containing protein n=1 Tax=Neonectria ditissima TaxID=78410 RepID=A0A0P7AWX0_9HYPO|nr:hypothetical protein AK830_g8625 [Neonectria ditissima]
MRPVRSWKSTCYIGDWSPLLKIRIRGPESKAFLEYLSTNHWPNFKPFQAKHAILCQDNGTIMGEGVVMMLRNDDFIFTSVPGVTWALHQFHRGSRKFNATIDIVTDEWYLFQVQGPKSVEVMEAATQSSVTDLKFMHSKDMSINGSKFWCLRQGVSGERGFELWGPADEGQAVYKAIMASGAKYGIRQLGGRAKPVNHKMISLCIIDKKYSLPGTEVTVKWGQAGGLQKLIRAIVEPAPYKEDQRKKSLKV